MDLNNLLKLAGLAAQLPEANTTVGDSVPGKANTRPDPKVFPDGPSNLGSVSDTSLRRYLKAKGQPVSVEETTYPDYSVEEVLESYVEYTAEKAKNPYAIGMASAMKTTGDKPPLKKSTINKAHKIAKGIGESSLNEAAWKLEGGKTHMVGGNLNYDDKLEYLLSDEDADILNNFFAQADDAEKSKVWKMFWDHEEMGHDAEGPELAIQYAKDAMGMNEAEGHDPGWHPDPLDFRGWYTTNPAEIPSYMRSTERGKKSLASKNVSKLKSHIKGSLGKHRKANLPEDDEAMSGTYARVIYDYSEDFGMITLYNNGNKIDEWSGYFGADTVGNPLAAKFVEIAKKNGLNPEGMSIVDDEGEKGTFGNNTFNWDQFATDETGMNESINESYILELKRVLKNSGQLLNEAGGIGGGISGSKPGAGFKAQALLKPKANAPASAVNAVRPDVVARNEPNLQQLMSKLPGMDQSKANRQELGFAVQGDRAGPQTGQPTPSVDKPFTLGRFANQGMNLSRTTMPTRPTSPPPPPMAARPEGPAAGMPRATPGGARPEGPAAGMPRATPGGARPEGPAAGMPRATPGGARPEGPAAAMPKAPPQPASFKDAFRAARKAAGGAGGVFMWNGKPYQTNIKGEKGLAWNSKDLKQVGNWSASESADANGIAVNEAVAKIACTKCDEVSTAAAWNKNHDTCPKCKTSKQGVAEAAKPDFLDMDKDGDKKEPMKKAVKDKEKVSESIAYLKRLAGL